MGIEYDDDLTQDNKNQTALLMIENYRAGRGFTWRLKYDWRRTEYDVSPPWEYQRASAELGYWVGSGTRIFGAGGKETAWDDPFDPSMEDSFWEAGFAHTAGENLSAEFAAGERSFGSSWRGNLDYQFRRGSTSLSYVESPTTTGYGRGAGTRTVLDPTDFDDYLDRPGSDERYLMERLQWNLTLQFRRLGFDLSAFDEDRTGRVTTDGEMLEDQSETGVRATIDWKLGVRTEIAVTGSMLDRETSLDAKTKFLSAGLNVTYKLGARTDLTLGYSYAEEEPRGQIPTGRDYVENVISLYFTYTI